jgi:hypothetical protein
MASSSERSDERSLKQMIDDNDIDGVVGMIKTSNVNAYEHDRPLLQYLKGEQKTLLQYMIELGKVEMLTRLIHTRHTTRRRNRLVGYSDLTYRYGTNGETSIHSIFKAPLESIEPMWNYIQKRYKYIPRILNYMDLRDITPFYIALQNVIECFKCLRQQWSDTAVQYINFMIKLVQVNRDTIYLSDYINTTQETELRKVINSQTLIIPYNLGNRLLVLLEVSNTIIDADSDSTDDEDDDMQLSGPTDRSRQAGLRFKF